MTDGSRKSDLTTNPFFPDWYLWFLDTIVFKYPSVLKGPFIKVAQFHRSGKRIKCILAIWQHLSLLIIRQYKGKSYSILIEWLVRSLQSQRCNGKNISL